MSDSFYEDRQRVLRNRRVGMTVAQWYPPFTDGNGTVWYRTGMSGSWTAQACYADPSYTLDNTEPVGYSQGELFDIPKGHP